MTTPSAVRLHAAPTIQKGQQFARVAIALANCKGEASEAAKFAERWRDTPAVAHALRQKAAVAGGTIAGSAWADDLVMPGIATDFVEAVRAVPVIDRLQGVRKVPFIAGIPRETSAGFGAGWGGHGRPRPVKKTAFDSLTLPIYRPSVVTVLTEELVLSMHPAHELAVRDVLVAAVAEFMDEQFLDPSVSLVAGVSPASITSGGGTEITSSGATAAQKFDDFKRMIQAVATKLVAPVWIMQVRDAVALAGTLTTGGSLMFPNIHASGGTLLGIPVLVSAAVPDAAGSPATDRYIVLLDAASVCIADDGRADVALSRNVSVQMDDAPTNNAATGTGASMVSMFQTSSVAFRVQREISWLAAHANCSAYMKVSY